MAEFDEKTLEKLAKLCRIECTDDEKKALHQHLASILNYVEQLNEIDTEGVSPCDRVLPTLVSVLREDSVGEKLSRDLFLANAPAQVGGMIRVPPVIKSEG
jgi:aspartyl-tRNA(Asn)/glutamyl-tRNA(Gln) amidotransferase subunit C